MAWYNINSQDTVTAETLEKIKTERCGFCGQEKRVRKRMKIYFSEFEMVEKPVCQECYVQNSKKAIAT